MSNVNINATSAENTKQLGRPLIEEMKKQLMQLQPAEKQAKAELFQKLFPEIKDAVDRQVPRKRILEQLEKFGLKLHPTKFKALWEAENARRAAASSEEVA